MHLEIFNSTVLQILQKSTNCDFQIRLHSFQQVCYKKGKIQLFDLSTLIIHESHLVKVLKTH